MTRRPMIRASAALLLIAAGGLTATVRSQAGAARPPGVMLMNRIGPSSSELYVAKADGSGERRLFAEPGFDYHASYSTDGRWIVFTSERAGLGQADIYRARVDGTGLEALTDSPALDDQGALSPDGTQLAFVSTRRRAPPTSGSSICVRARSAR